jgi:hypothetical protein
MLFYALRVVCPACSAAFLVGGGAGHDLTCWRRTMVGCVRCGLPISAQDAPAVPLRPDRSAQDASRAVEKTVEDLVPA